MSAIKYIGVLCLGVVASSTLCLIWLNIAHTLGLGAWDRGWWAGQISGTVSTLTYVYIWSRLTR